MPFPRLWTHLRLSAEMLRRPPDVLLVPAHVLPLVHPRRSLVTVHDLGYLHEPEAHRAAGPAVPGPVQPLSRAGRHPPPGHLPGHQRRPGPPLRRAGRARRGDAPGRRRVLPAGDGPGGAGRGAGQARHRRRVHPVCRHPAAAQEPGAPGQGLRARWQPGIRRCSSCWPAKRAGCTTTSCARRSAWGWLIACSSPATWPRRTCRPCTPARWPLPSPASTRALACRCWRPWPAARRWWRPTSPACRRWWATPACWWTPPMRPPWRPPWPRAAGDPALRAELRRRGLERARLFSWERCARETLEAMGGDGRAVGEGACPGRRRILARGCRALQECPFSGSMSTQARQTRTAQWARHAVPTLAARNTDAPAAAWDQANGQSRGISLGAWRLPVPRRVCPAKDVCRALQADRRSGRR